MQLQQVSTDALSNKYLIKWKLNHCCLLLMLKNTAGS
jgi:hypothetical protein